MKCPGGDPRTHRLGAGGHDEGALPGGPEQVRTASVHQVQQGG